MKLYEAVKKLESELTNEESKSLLRSLHGTMIYHLCGKENDLDEMFQKVTNDQEN